MDHPKTAPRIWDTPSLSATCSSARAPAHRETSRAHHVSPLVDARLRRAGLISWRIATARGLLVLGSRDHHDRRGPWSGLLRREGERRLRLRKGWGGHEGW